MVRSFRAVNVLKLVTVPDFSSLKFSVFKESVFLVLVGCFGISKIPKFWGLDGLRPCSLGMVRCARLELTLV